VVQAGEESGYGPVAEPPQSYVLAVDDFGEDEQVPLLVVLLGSALHDAAVDRAGDGGAVGEPAGGPVGGALPCVVGDPGQYLEGAELPQVPGAAVDEVDETSLVRWLSLPT